MLCAVRQRKRQQAMLAKKNAERTVRKTHFRSHHCLPRVSEDKTSYLFIIIFVLSISHNPFFFFFCYLQQTTAARKPAPAKDESFFGAFQGLSLDGLMGGTAGSAAVSAPAAGGGDPCKVM